MNLLEFERLCRDASLQLGLEDTGALGQGFTVAFDDVLFETAFVDGRDRFALIAELGCVSPEHKKGVYENLLTMQVLTWTQPGVRFGFHPERETLVLCTEVRLHAVFTGAGLATLMRSVATQIAHWRTTLLIGELGDTEPSANLTTAGAAFMSKAA